MSGKKPEDMTDRTQGVGLLLLRAAVLLAAAQAAAESDAGVRPAAQLATNKVVAMTYAISPYCGKPTLLINGNPTPLYALSHTWDANAPGSEAIHRKFAAHGCRWYLLCVRGGVDGDWGTTQFWTDDNVFPDVIGEAAAGDNLTRQAALTLKACPDARFWVRMGCSPPIRWRKRLPGELLLNGYGKRYEEPSLASDRYNEQVGRYVERVVRWCERQPWGDRVAGYLVYPIGEGTTQLTCEGFLFDQSPVMRAAFREHFRARHGREAEVPSDRDWVEKGRPRYRDAETDGRSVTNIPHRLHWPDPSTTLVEREYCLFMRELTKRNFQTLLRAIKRAAPGKLAGLDAFKQTLLGWPLVARWVGDYSTHAGAMHAVSGAFAMAELLDLPELDVVATPHDYTHRGMGFGYEPEGIGDAVVARGKMMWVEEDARTFSKTEHMRWNPFLDLHEARAGFWRNLGAALSRGFNTYPMDVCGPSFFMDDGIQAILARRRVVHESATFWDRREVPSIVMVVDDSSVLEEDLTFGYQYLAVMQQRLVGLSRCGVPYRLHLFEDLAREDFPACHKVFLFPNLFRVTPERLDVLRRRVFRNGNVAVFGPASGITDGTRLSAETATELTGIPLELVHKESPRWVTVDRFDHALTQGLTRRLDYGDSLAYGPLLVPREDPKLKRLGGIQWPTARDGAGLVVRPFADHTRLFTCAMPLPGELLREVARMSGTHVYSEGDDLICADSCTLMVHSVVPGKRTIRLPRPSTVWDLVTGRKIGDDLSEVSIEVTPPHTSLFYLGPDPSLAP